MSLLKQFLDVVSRRKKIIIVIVLAFTLLPLLFSLSFRSVYKASSQLWMHTNATQTQYLALPTNISKFEYSDKNKLDNTFFAMLKNPKSMKRIISTLHITDEKERLIDPDKFIIGSEFNLFFSREGISVNVVESGDVIEVAGYSATPEMAEKVANAAVEAFMILYADIFKDEARLAQKAMKARLVYVNRELRKLERRLYRYRKKYGIIDVTMEIEEGLRQYYSYLDLVHQNTKTMEEEKKVLEEVTKTIAVIPELYLSNKAIERNPTLESYKQEIVTLETTIAKLKVDFTEAHPDIIASRMQIAEYKKAIYKEIERILGDENFSRNSYYTELEKRYYDTKINLEIYKTTGSILLNLTDIIYKKMLNVKKIELLFNKIERQQSSLNTEYSNLTKGISDTEILLSLSPSNLAVLNYADASTISSPYFPNRVKFLAISLFLSITIAFSIILLEESADKSIKTLAEAQKAFQGNLLYGLPKYTKIFGFNIIPKRLLRYFPTLRDELLLLKQRNFVRKVLKNNAIRRSVWNIISGIKVVSGDTIARSILFTGAEEEVGTTTIALLVARELTVSGKKTLFLDISSTDDWHLQGKDILPVDKKITLKDLIRSSDIYGMDVLLMKEIADIPGIAMIDGLPEQLNNLDYEHIIIDAAPVVACNDVLFLSATANVVLLTAKLHKTSKETIEEAFSRFKHLKTSKTGIIINQI
ncbi:hypothetical protein [Candidatus Kuenenia sp.]|uniref:GumC family protein n=1 Tax=Candidatus Kuenenia sp. TaxID=2499824 RepID=UPI00321F8C5A